MPADRLLHPRAGKSAKVSMLTDLEYRVWTQYILSADDFGVMRGVPLPFQNDNDHLANRRPKEIQRCIDQIVERRLLYRFEHQGHLYICQHDWQDWQKVTWPSRTIAPQPPRDLLQVFSPWTQLLFSVHPGGKKAPKKPEHIASDVSGIDSEVLQSGSEELSPSRARERAKRLIDNGSGLTANGFRFDVAFLKLKGVYPPHRMTDGLLTEQEFYQAIDRAGGDPEVAFGRMLSNLATQKSGEQWQDKKMVPKLENWLKSGACWQVHEPAEVKSPRVGPMVAYKCYHTPECESEEYHKALAREDIQRRIDEKAARV